MAESETGSLPRYDGITFLVDREVYYTDYKGAVVSLCINVLGALSPAATSVPKSQCTRYSRTLRSPIKNFPTEGEDVHDVTSQPRLTRCPENYSS